MIEVRAGTALLLPRRFNRAEGVTLSVNPSTAKMAVTAPDGTDTALIVAVTFDGDEAVLVEAVWTIPDAAAHGVYIVTTDVSGNMVAAHEEYIAVKARTLAVMP